MSVKTTLSITRSEILALIATKYQEVLLNAKDEELESLATDLCDLSQGGECYHNFSIRTNDEDNWAYRYDCLNSGDIEYTDGDY